MLAWIRDRVLLAYLRIPEHPMKYRIVQWLGRSVFPAQGIVAKAPPGMLLKLHPRDWIEYLLLRGERYEPLTLDFLAGNLDRAEVAVLAGVNFGLHAAVAAAAVGSAGRVIGIEPQPAALLRARANLALNRLNDRVQLTAAALGAEEAFVHMPWSRPENAAAASILDEGPGLTVTVITLDRILAAAPERPKLLLLDIEGYELFALGGLSLELAPPIAVVELEPKLLIKSRVKASELCGRLRGLGYELTDLHGRPVADEPNDLPERNLVAVKPGTVVRWAAPAN